MPVKTVNLSDLARELGKWSEWYFDELKQAARAGAEKSIPELVKASPVDTGHYASSWAVIETDDAIYVGNTSPHAPIIEHGARPFTPPIAPLLAWAKRVLQDPSQPPDYSSQVWALAKYTQKKIAEKGMVPRKVLEQQIPMIIRNIADEFRKV